MGAHCLLGMSDGFYSELLISVSIFALKGNQHNKSCLLLSVNYSLWQDDVIQDHFVAVERSSWDTQETSCSFIDPCYMRFLVHVRSALFLMFVSVLNYSGLIKEKGYYVLYNYYLRTISWCNESLKMMSIVK